MPFRRGQSGNPRGRPRGAKDKIPRSFRTLVHEFVTAHSGDIVRALRKGVKGKDAHRYLAIVAGLERQQVEHSGENGGPIRVTFGGRYKPQEQS